jgi:HEAT repeat protein
VVSNPQGPFEQPANDVDTLVVQLSDAKGLVRQRARLALVDIGKPAVPALIGALNGAHAHARWEAAKALTEVQDARAVPALVGALEDKEFGVRWLAAQALSALGAPALEPLLQQLVKKPGSIWLRDGARHVLKALAADGFEAEVEPVLKALADIQPVSVVPQAALAALSKLSAGNR